METLTKTHMIIPIQLDLIELTRDDLFELSEIVKDGVYDTNVIIQKLNKIYTQLIELNKTSKETYEEVKQLKIKLDRQFQEQHQEMNNVIEASNDLIKLSNELQKELKKKNPNEKKMDKLKNKYELEPEKFHNLSNWDSKLVSEFLTNSMHVYFADKTKWSLRWLMFNFQSMNAVSHIFSFTAISFISFLSENIFQLLYQEIPEYIIGLLVAGVLTMTVEKRWKEFGKKQFWRKAKTEALKLLLSLNEYLDRANLLLSSYQRLKNEK